MTSPLSLQTMVQPFVHPAQGLADFALGLEPLVSQGNISSAFEMPHVQDVVKMSGYRQISDYSVADVNQGFGRLREELKMPKEQAELLEIWRSQSLASDSGTVLTNALKVEPTWPDRVHITAQKSKAGEVIKDYLHVDLFRDLLRQPNIVVWQNQAGVLMVGDPDKGQFFTGAVMMLIRQYELYEKFNLNPGKSLSELGRQIYLSIYNNDPKIESFNRNLRPQDLSTNASQNEAEITHSGRDYGQLRLTSLNRDPNPLMLVEFSFLKQAGSLGRLYYQQGVQGVNGPLGQFMDEASLKSAELLIAEQNQGPRGYQSAHQVYSQATEKALERLVSPFIGLYTTEKRK